VCASVAIPYRNSREQKNNQQPVTNNE